MIGGWEMSEQPLLKEELSFISRDARTMVLDVIYCELANFGSGLTGNTEESDIEWLARRIHGSDRPYSCKWDLLSEEDRQRYLRLAETCLREMPPLMERISSRCLAQAKAIQTLLEAERTKRNRKRKK